LRAIIDFLSDGFFIDLPIWTEGSLLHDFTGRVTSFMFALAVAEITSRNINKNEFPCFATAIAVDKLIDFRSFRARPVRKFHFADAQQVLRGHSGDSRMRNA